MMWDLWIKDHGIPVRHERYGQQLCFDLDPGYTIDDVKDQVEELLKP